MYFKKKMITGAVALATLAVSAPAFAVTVDVTKGNNLYYTGQVPKNYELVDTDDPAPAPQLIQNYFGHMLSTQDYPTVVDSYESVKVKVGNGPDGLPFDPEDLITTPVDDDEYARPANCPGPDDDAGNDPDPTDDNQTCYGTAPAVIALPAVDAPVFISITGSINDAEDGPTGAEGKVGTLNENELAESSVIGLWVQASAAGAGVLADTASLVTHRDDIEDGEGHTSASFAGVTFMASNQGFVPLGDTTPAVEFRVSELLAGTPDGFYGSVTPPTGATHLLLGYNTGRGSFDISDTGAFTVEIQDTDFVPGHQNPNVEIQTTATPNTDGKYEVTVGDSLAFTTSTPVLEDGADVGTTVWTIGTDTASVSDANTFTYSPTAAGEFDITYTLTDSVGAIGTDTVTVVVLSDDNNAPTASFTATVSADNPKVYSFDAGASADVDAGDTLTYAWSFGDGNQGAGETVSHTYAADGSYTVTLTVTDDSAPTTASDTDTDTVTVVTPVETSSGGGGGAMSLFFGLGLLLPAFVRRRLK